MAGRRHLDCRRRLRMKSRQTGPGTPLGPANAGFRVLPGFKVIGETEPQGVFGRAADGHGGVMDAGIETGAVGRIGQVQVGKGNGDGPSGGLSLGCGGCRGQEKG